MWTGLPTEQQIKSLKLISGEEVFKMMGRFKKISHKEMIPNASEMCLDLIDKMLDFNPDNRPSIEQIMQHPYLK